VVKEDVAELAGFVTVTETLYMTPGFRFEKTAFPTSPLFTIVGLAICTPFALITYEYEVAPVVPVQLSVNADELVETTENVLESGATGLV
jgi:hypothetical protein